MNIEKFGHKSQMQNIIFIHGLESSGKGFKGQLLRSIFPECLTPDFEKYNPNISIKILLEKRMTQLNLILKDKDNWIIIGSSFGGLMGALYTCQNPKKVSKLILLAPYLSIPEFNSKKYSSVDIPVIIFHGKRDKIALIDQSRPLAEAFFTNLTYNIVNDNHYLHKTVKRINWKKLI
ncbi:MAG: alpha/beta hydrolase [Promethearchaeota archaeon]|nr:MAG: alpha/beta hydrolase [Candidatus Lokiarchaeota archaeon]